MKAKYIKNKGIRCPYCESEKIFADGQLNTDGHEYGVAKDLVRCYDCGNEWYDIYKLHDIELVQERQIA